MLVEWILDGKINHESARQVLDCVAHDYEKTRAKSAPKADASAMWASTIENMKKGH